MAKLIIVPTPIGNLEDITFRAVRILKEASIIFAEDTRTSGILLKHYDIQTKMISHHKFNEHKTLQNTIKTIQQHELVALISDAGTPAISDPGFLMVRECVKNGIEVECLPGATAFIPALVNSGFPCDSFCFEGFLPQKKGRQTKFLQLKDENRTLVFYESPHRLIKTLEQIIEFWGNRQVSVSRELTKFHEETTRGTALEVAEFYKTHTLKGEIVLVVEGKELEKKLKEDKYANNDEEED
jgi:16S rRNA (cytidine1402-2'-O)-methyltransferase